MKNTKLEKLQSEYNELYDRLGYMKNTVNITAVNRRLDELAEQMDKIIAEKNNK